MTATATATATALADAAGTLYGPGYGREAEESGRASAARRTLGAVACPQTLAVAAAIAARRHGLGAGHCLLAGRGRVGEEAARLLRAAARRAEDRLGRAADARRAAFRAAVAPRGVGPLAGLGRVVDDAAVRWMAIA